MKLPPLRIRLHRALRVLTPDGFALAPLWLQLAAIFASSAAIILLWAPLLGSLSQSYRLFSDPSSYADAEDIRQLFFGFFQMGFGLILFSFIISVLSSALEQLIERIRGGTRPYAKGGHLLLVNNHEVLHRRSVPVHRVWLTLRNGRELPESYIWPTPAYADRPGRGGVTPVDEVDPSRCGCCAAH